MKSTLITIFVLLTFSSCQFPKEYECYCQLTVTTDGQAMPGGSVTSTLYGKKNDVREECDREELKYTYIDDLGPSTHVYTAACNLK